MPPFPVGRLGRMKTTLMPCASAHSSKWWQVNSGLFSTVVTSGRRLASTTLAMQPWSRSLSPLTLVLEPSYSSFFENLGLD